MTSIRPLATFRCHVCKRQFSDETYAIDEHDRKICDECAYADELNRIETQDKYFVYGPTDLRRGAKVTNWTGRELATILDVGGVHHWTIRSHWGERYYCHIRTPLGRVMGGYIGEGLASNIKVIPSMN